MSFILRLTKHLETKIQNSGVEFSGRSCAGINEVNFKAMAEAVSTGHQQLTFDSAFCQLDILDNKILEVVSASPGEKTISASLGEVSNLAILWCRRGG